MSSLHLTESTRVIVSVEDPAVCGMTRRIGLLGYSFAACAASAEAGSDNAAASSTDAEAARFMGDPPRCNANSLQVHPRRQPGHDPPVGRALDVPVERHVLADRVHVAQQTLRFAIQVD